MLEPPYTVTRSRYRGLLRESAGQALQAPHALLRLPECQSSGRQVEGICFGMHESCCHTRFDLPRTMLRRRSAFCVKVYNIEQTLDSRDWEILRLRLHPPQSSPRDKLLEWVPGALHAHNKHYSDRLSTLAANLGMIPVPLVVCTLIMIIPIARSHTANSRGCNTAQAQAILVQPENNIHATYCLLVLLTKLDRFEKRRISHKVRCGAEEIVVIVVESSLPRRGAVGTDVRPVALIALTYLAKHL